MNLLLFNLKTDADDPVLGFTTDWANALATRFDHVVVITMESGCVRVADNVTVYSVGREKGYSEFRRTLNFYRTLFKVLRHYRFDVCFAHMMPVFSVLAWPLLFVKKVPIVLWYAHRSVTPTLKVAHALVDRVVTANIEGFRIPSRKLYCIGHGISLNKFSKSIRSENEVFTVASVGRISAIKNIDVIVRGFALALQLTRAPMRLMIIGGALNVADRAYLEELKSLVSSLALENSVEFVGAVAHDKVADHLSQADLAISLSVTRSFDKAILEIMSMGIPILVHNDAFLPVLQDGKASPESYLLGDLDPNTLAAGIVRWQNPNWRLERAGELRTLSESVRAHHGLDQLVDKLMAHFYSAISARRH